MIWIAFGRWSSYASKWFVMERIWWKGYKWTPFVRVRIRYGGKKRKPDETL